MNQVVMKKHTKIYMDYFSLGIDDYIPCEVCQCPAVDIHHLEPRGMGGSKTKDTIENLAALCRECHIFAEDDPKFNKRIKHLHKLYINFEDTQL
jgi:5-methylcytosine-specific restriction endonuclease McrA